MDIADENNVFKTRLLFGDCLDLYKTLEPKSIDLILTDLPYGTTACKWDTIIPFDKLWEMVNYLLKPNGVFVTTASQPFTSALVMSNPKMFKYEWIWEKDSGGNFATIEYAPMKISESILIFYKKTPITFNPLRIMRSEKSLTRFKIGTACKIKGGEPQKMETYANIKKQDHSLCSDGTKHPENIIYFPKYDVPRFSGIKHPTKKPVALYEYLAKTYSNEGMVIFDPCMGSGTTGVACKNTNRNFIGIEKDGGYFNIAKERICGNV